MKYQYLSIWLYAFKSKAKILTASATLYKVASCCTRLSKGSKLEVLASRREGEATSASCIINCSTYFYFVSILNNRFTHNLNVAKQV